MLDQNQCFLGVVVATLEAQLSHLSNMSTAVDPNKRQWPVHKHIELHTLLEILLGHLVLSTRSGQSLEFLHILHVEFQFFHLPRTRLRHAINSGHHSSISTSITPKSMFLVWSFTPAYLRVMPVLNRKKWPPQKASPFTADHHRMRFQTHLQTISIFTHEN